MNTLRRLFPTYFGIPTAQHINATALQRAEAHLSQLLTDRDLLQGQIDGYAAIVLRLKPSIYPDIQA